MLSSVFLCRFRCFRFRHLWQIGLIKGMARIDRKSEFIDVSPEFSHASTVQIQMTPQTQTFELAVEKFVFVAVVRFNVMGKSCFFNSTFPLAFLAHRLNFLIAVWCASAIWTNHIVSARVFAALMMAYTHILIIASDPTTSGA
jgi:hypothetical protein